MPGNAPPYPTEFSAATRYRYAALGFDVRSVNWRVPWVLAWSSGEPMVPTSVQLVPLDVRCTTNDVSVMELSFQDTTTRRLLPVPVVVKVSPSALAGGNARVTGRIMS